MDTNNVMSDNEKKAKGFTMAVEYNKNNDKYDDSEKFRSLNSSFDFFDFVNKDDKDSLKEFTTKENKL